MFLVKIELWQIDNSIIAPKFNIVSSPNNWSKIVKKSQTNDKSDLELKQLEFWTKFSDYLGEHSKIFKPKSYQKPQYWYDLALNVKYAFISLTINSNTKSITSQIYINDNKALFDYLLEQKDEIEKEVGQLLFWDKKDNRKVCKIALSHNINPMDEKNWDKIIEILLKDSEKLYEVFKKRIDEYNNG